MAILIKRGVLPTGRLALRVKPVSPSVEFQRLEKGEQELQHKPGGKMLARETQRCTYMLNKGNSLTHSRRKLYLKVLQCSYEYCFGCMSLMTIILNWVKWPLSPLSNKVM